MSLNTYISKCVGEKQNAFKGGVIQKGREGWMEIIAVSHNISSPRDVASGQATGKRVHAPITSRMYYDQSLPMWHTSLVYNESLKEVVFAFFSPNKLGTAGGQGVETLTYEIKLTNAFVSKLELDMPNNKNPDLQRYETMLIISKVYQKIEGTWKLGNKVWQDDWLAPV
jgi:type VI secretion system secreted protein Hcp